MRASCLQSGGSHHTGAEAKGWGLAALSALDDSLQCHCLHIGLTPVHCSAFELLRLYSQSRQLWGGIQPKAGVHGGVPVMAQLRTGAARARPLATDSTCWHSSAVGVSTSALGASFTSGAKSASLASCCLSRCERTDLMSRGAAGCLRSSACHRQ